jgi:hypothetical protein
MFAMASAGVAALLLALGAGILLPLKLRNVNNPIHNCCWQYRICCYKSYCFIALTFVYV